MVVVVQSKQDINVNDFRLRSCLIGFYNVKDLGGLVKCESGNERSVNVINIKVLLLNVWI